MRYVLNLSGMLQPENGLTHSKAKMGLDLIVQFRLEIIGHGLLYYWTVDMGLHFALGIPRWTFAVLKQHFRRFFFEISSYLQKI